MSEITDTTAEHIGEEIRFSVEKADRPGYFTPIWRFWMERNDAYFAARAAKGKSKFSFHESGVCHLKRYQNGVVITDLRWKIPPSDFSLILSVAFPTDLQLAWFHGSEPVKQGKKWISVTSAPPGQAVRFSFVSIFGAQKGSPPELVAGLGGLAHVAGQRERKVAMYVTMDQHELGPIEVNALKILDRSDTEPASKTLMGFFDPADGEPLRIVSMQGVSPPVRQPPSDS